MLALTRIPSVSRLCVAGLVLVAWVGLVRVGLGEGETQGLAGQGARTGSGGAAVLWERASGGVDVTTSSDFGGPEASTPLELLVTDDHTSQANTDTWDYPWLNNNHTMLVRPYQPTTFEVQRGNTS